MVTSTTAVSSGGSEAAADWLGPKVGGHSALVLQSSNEPSELWRWQCHGDSTVNIVVAIMITVIVIIRDIAACVSATSEMLSSCSDVLCARC